NQVSFIQDFDVEVAQTQFIADPVIGVVQSGSQLNVRVFSTSGYIDVYENRAIAGALKKLTGEDYGQDRRAWAAWWREQQRQKKLDALKKKKAAAAGES
ncbi:MAG: hypothetical protein ACE5JG_06300, partial [Planctomycetota bacterium]